MEEMWIIDFRRVERKCERASWVVRIGWVRFMSMVAYVEGVSVEGGWPGGSQKLGNGWKVTS